MNTVGCSPHDSAERNAFGSLTFSAASRTRLDARSNAEVSLLTADGDKVTLSIAAAVRAEHTTYDFLGRLQGQTISAHAEKLQISTSTKVAATVQGALDEEELVDIEKLLDVLETTAGDLFSGKSDGALAALAETNDLDSIASFEAVLSYSRDVAAERTHNVTSAAAAAPANAAAINAADAPPMVQKAEPLLERLAALLEHLEDVKGVDTYPERFAELFQKLAKNLPLDEHEQKLLDRTQSEYLKRS